MLNLLDKKFGRLTVLSESSRGKNNKRRWLCKCDCGNEIIIYQQYLTSGTKSCGCLHKEAASINASKIFTKHGLSFSKEWRTWNRMIQKCYSPNHDRFKYYGAKGITVCDRWKYSFDNFLSDMGCAPSDKHSIERNNNRGIYEPSNCRWATQKEQNNNYSRCNYFTIDGITKNITQLAQEYNINPKTVFTRLRKGKSIKGALTT